MVGVGNKVFREHTLAVGIDFAEGDGAESSASGGKSKSADAAEEIEMGWLLIHSQTPKCRARTNQEFLCSSKPN